MRETPTLRISAWPRRRAAQPWRTRLDRVGGAATSAPMGASLRAPVPPSDRSAPGAPDALLAARYHGNGSECCDATAAQCLTEPTGSGSRGEYTVRLSNPRCGAAGKPGRARSPFTTVIEYEPPEVCHVGSV